ncbi:hypothetical protein TRVL_00536 [Trypanosoma vivax]|nr:hypothetical protein TRVL_00536 [Trypanosoma vivax]
MGTVRASVLETNALFSGAVRGSLGEPSCVMYCLALWVLYIVLPVAGDRAGSGVDDAKECPNGCREAKEWCEKHFARGGNVTLDRCDQSAFTCGCNGAAAITVHVNEGECSWNGSFDVTETNGTICMARTALCPTGCGVVIPWVNRCVANTQCITLNDGYNFSCTTCEGQTYSVVMRDGVCKKQFLGELPDCDPKKTCNNRGCCRKPGSPGGPCDCFRNPKNQPTLSTKCPTCDENNEKHDEHCLPERTGLEVFFSSIGSTWAMVLPMLSVLFFFVVLLLFRRECESEKSFQSTELRKTGLSTVQVARRGQAGLFHPKRIPERPPQSRCFVNQEINLVRGRGPSAY